MRALRVLTDREYLRRGHEISHLASLMLPQTNVAAGRRRRRRRRRLVESARLVVGRPGYASSDGAR